MRDMIRMMPSIRMLAEKEDTAELMLYGQIITDMPEDWKWSKEDKSAADFDRDIKEIRKNGATKLNIRINSPGGIVSEAIAMRSIITGAGFEEINVRIEGLCASAATDIATIPGANVEITKGSEYMIHNPWGFAIGNANEMERYVQHLRQLEDTSIQMYKQKCGKEEEQIREWMDAETWFTAEQAVENGFCDRIAEDAAPAAACAGDMMRVMKSIYNRVPDSIREQEEEPANDVSNDTPVAGASSENMIQEETNMDIKEITMEALAAENPALLEQIQQNAVAAERQRIEDIDALTMNGYEDLARECKESGVSAMEFQKKVVALQKQKGADFLASRKAETEPAQSVTAQANTDNDLTEDDEIKSFAEEAKKLYANVRTDMGGMF